MTTEDSTPRATRKSPMRFPAWTVVLLGLAIGGVVASWMGAGLGGLLGVIIWLARR